MGKQEVIIDNTDVEDVLRILDRELRRLNWRNLDVIQGTRHKYKLIYLGTKSPYPDNRIEIKYCLIEDPKDKFAHSGWTVVGPAMRFEGSLLNTESVLLSAEYEDFCKHIFDEFWANLFKAYENQLTQEPVREQKIIFEETLPLTPDVLQEKFREYRNQHANSLIGTAIERLGFEPLTLDEFLSGIYIIVESPTLDGFFIGIEFRRLNGQSTHLVINSSEYGVVQSDESTATIDQFLLGFVAFLESEDLKKKSSQEAYERRRKKPRNDALKRVALALYLEREMLIGRRIAASKAGTSTTTINKYENFQEVQKVLEDFRKDPNSVSRFQKYITQVKADRKSKKSKLNK